MGNSEAEEGEIPDETGGGQGIPGGGMQPYVGQTAPASGGGPKPKKAKVPRLELLWQPGDSALRLGDVQNLVLWALAEGPSPRWCKVKPKAAVKRVILLLAHGLDEGLWTELGQAAMPTLCREFGPHPVTVLARKPNLVPAQTTHALLTLPLNRKRALEAEAPGNGSQAQQQQQSPDGAACPPSKRLKLAADHDVSERHTVQLAAGSPAAVPAATDDKEPLPPLASYVLTLDQLEEAEYPLPAFTEGGDLVVPQGYVATKSCGPSGTPAHPLVALDCEMVTTAEGLELARMTVVDGSGGVLADMCVVPRNPVLDYNTRYSGITAAALEGVGTRLADAQAAFRALVSAETVVVAHSGQNDLRALRIIHANVIDTALLYPHPKGPPARSALRVLATRFLDRQIQRGGEAGHDPQEDARAALDLALLKAAKGPGFGAAAAGRRGEALATVLAAAGRKGSLVGDLSVAGRYCGAAFGAVRAGGEGEVGERLAREAGRPGVEFVWAQFMGLHRVYEDRLAALVAAAEGGAPGPEEWRRRLREAAAALDVAVARVWGAATPGTLVVVATGQGDTLKQQYLTQQRYDRQEKGGGGVQLPAWVQEDEAALQALSDRVVRGLCFVGLKQ